MPYKIALNFEDGVTRFIDATAGESVADAAYRQGVNIPLDCRVGACGACKCQVESGRYALGDDFIEDALSAAEAAQGMALTCQMRAQSDCVVRVPVASTACRIRQGRLQAAIRAIQPLSESTLSLELEGSELHKLAFLPGQYVNLQVPGHEETRAYSFSSLVRDGRVSFLIRNVPGGLMSGYLTGAAQAGDALTLSGPLGSFYLREVRRPLLLLAGGTGLAPFLAMLEQLAASGSEQPVHLIYGVTHDHDLVALEQLTAFATQLPRFTWRACVASAESSYPHKGYVTDHLDSAPLHDGEVDLYLCGPTPMVEAVRQTLQQRGIQPANFYYEKFAASA